MLHLLPGGQLAGAAVFEDHFVAGFADALDVDEGDAVVKLGFVELGDDGGGVAIGGFAVFATGPAGHVFEFGDELGAEICDVRRNGDVLGDGDAVGDDFFVVDLLGFALLLGGQGLGVEVAVDAGGEIGGVVVGGVGGVAEFAKDVVEDGLAVCVPVAGLDEEDAPAEGAEDFGLEKVALHGVFVGVEAGGVDEDAELEGVVAGLADGEVADEVGLADVAGDLVADFFEGVGQGGDDGVWGVRNFGGVAGELEAAEDAGSGLEAALADGLGVLEVAAKAVGAVVVGVGDGGVADAADDDHVVLGAREDDVEALFAAVLVDGAEVHEHAPRRVGAVTDAQDDDVALVALDVFEVLDEEADELVVFFAFVLGLEAFVEGVVFAGQGHEGAFDGGLLGLGEGDDADGLADVFAEHGAHELGDVGGFGFVAAFVVDAGADAMEADAAREDVGQVARGFFGLAGDDGGAVGLGHAAVGDGEEFALVEAGVGEADEGFAAAAVVPAEHGGGELVGGHGEKGVGLEFDEGIGVELVFAGCGGEEGGGGQLHFVTNDDHLAGAEDGGDGFFDGDLAGFVEDDDVEEAGIERQGIGDADGAHEPDGFEVVDDAAGVAAGHLTDGAVAHGLVELAFEGFAAGGVGFLELFLLVLQLGGGGGGDLQVAAEFVDDVGEDAEGVEVQELAMDAAQAGQVAVDLFHGKGGDGAVAAGGIGEGAVGDGGLEGSGLKGQLEEGVAEFATERVEFAKDGGDIGHLVYVGIDGGEGVGCFVEGHVAPAQETAEDAAEFADLWIEGEEWSDEVLAAAEFAKEAVGCGVGKGVAEFADLLCEVRKVVAVAALADGFAVIFQGLFCGLLCDEVFEDLGPAWLHGMGAEVVAGVEHFAQPPPGGFEEAQEALALASLIECDLGFVRWEFFAPVGGLLRGLGNRGDVGFFGAEIGVEGAAVVAVGVEEFKGLVAGVIAQAVGELAEGCEVRSAGDVEGEVGDEGADGGEELFGAGEAIGDDVDGVAIAKVVGLDDGEGMLGEGAVTDGLEGGEDAADGGFVGLPVLVEGKGFGDGGVEIGLVVGEGFAGLVVCAKVGARPPAEHPR